MNIGKHLQLIFNRGACGPFEDDRDYLVDPFMSKPVILDMIGIKTQSPPDRFGTNSSVSRQSLQ